MKSPRRITCRYDDPLDLVWVETARRLGVRVERSPDVYAAWQPAADRGRGDGLGILWLATPDDMDPDDCLAQMILHELCHALVEGEAALALPDWGLENLDDRDALRELACDRLQAALTARHGLRRVLALTTDWRAYYDALPDDPLAGDDDDAVLARQAWHRATEGPWAGPLDAALRATADIALAAQPYAGPESLWARFDGGDRPGLSPGGTGRGAAPGGDRDASSRRGSHRRRTTR